MPSSVDSIDLSTSKIFVIDHVKKVDESDEDDGRTSTPIRPQGSNGAESSYCWNDLLIYKRVSLCLTLVEHIIGISQGPNGIRRLY